MPFRKLAAVLLWLGVALAARLPAVGALPPPRSSCQRKCGDVDIPYPFGIGPESPDNCAMPGFFLSCKRTAGNNVSKPFFYDVEVFGISLQRGQARVMNRISSYCYNTSSQTMDRPSTWNLNLRNTPYKLSNTDNMFTVIGCRTLAYIGDEDNVGKYMSGCVATCLRGGATSLTNGSCSGIGCCHTAIPSGLQYYQVWFAKSFNTTEIYDVSRCSYAVLMDSSNFTFLTSYVTSPEFNNTNDGGRAPLVLDWAVGNETCEVAQLKPESYACVSSNSECINSSNGPGYICNCSQGFEGNPYLNDPDGCKDINECTELPEYPCSVAGTCHNIPGGFKCLCPRGYSKGNAQNGTCEKDRTLPLAIGIIIGAIIGGFGILLFSFGAVLLELLLRKQPIFTTDSGSMQNLSNYFIWETKRRPISEIVCAQVLEEAIEEEIKSVASLAEMCLRLRGEDRPTMKQVEMALQSLRMKRLNTRDLAPEENEEMQPLMSVRANLTYQQSQNCESLEKEYMSSLGLPH